MIVDSPLRFPECCRYQLLGDTAVTRRLARILGVLRPSARFAGHVDDRAAAKADYLVACDLAVPGAAAALRERDDPKLVVMPLPFGDVWSYWSLADYVLDRLRLGPPVHLSDADLLQTMVDIGRVKLAPDGKMTMATGDAFLFDKTDWLAPSIERIMAVLGKLADQASFDTYKMLMAGTPQLHWARYIARVFDTIQYFEHIDYARCQVMINGGVFSAEEMPFLAARLPVGAEVHNIDPEGHDHLDAYVRPWMEAGLQRFVEHRVALAEADGTLTLNTICTGQLAAQNDAGGKVFPARSIDSLVEAAGLDRVDLIKLDLEGGDFNAVRGAARTMLRFRPQFALSIYHSISDFWSIPQLVFELCPDYDFYIRTYSSERWETILYGVPKEVAAMRAAA